MATVPIPKDVLYSFAVAPGETITVTVQEGEVEWTGARAGTFTEPDGSMSAGQSEDFTVGHIFRAVSDSVLDFESVLPPPPPVEDTVPESAA